MVQLNLRTLVLGFSISCLVECKSGDPTTYITELVEDVQEKFAQDVKDHKVHPDYGLDIYQFLDKYGYPYKNHKITTEDGYIITAIRIPRGRNSSNEILKAENRPPIILQHGMATICFDYVIKGPGQALGLMLADAGWDVWLGNTRGSRYSRKHTTLDPDRDKDYWRFSWEEAGVYDTAALIDYIRATTGYKKVAYVGYSQGTTQFFTLTALRPEYNKKFAVMAALAPVAYMKHMTSSSLKLAAYNLDVLVQMFEELRMYEVLPYNKEIAEIVAAFCGVESPFQEFCIFSIFSFCGFHSEGLDKSLLPVYLYNSPGGMSKEMLEHYGQEIVSGHFRRFDFGEIGNLAKYNSTEPPDYNISAITTPIALYYSLNDPLSDVVDVERLVKELPNLVKLHLVKDKLFNHLDYIISKDVKTLVYDDLVEFLSGYVTGGKIY